MSELADILIATGAYRMAGTIARLFARHARNGDSLFLILKRRQLPAMQADFWGIKILNALCGIVAKLKLVYLRNQNIAKFVGFKSSRKSGVTMHY